jgi:ABC-2 type transport system permease protein
MRALAATARGAVAEMAGNPRALAGAAGVMFVNDIVWVLFWTLFFDEVGHIGAWDRDRMLLLLSVITASAGLALGLLANARQVGRMALDGELDAVLSLPVPTLPYLLVRRVEAVNVGDLGFGITLFLVACNPTPVRLLTWILVVLCAATLMTSFMVLTGSIAFFAGRSEGGELGVQAILLLGSYPSDVFAGVAKVVLYSVVPAVFVSAIPARIVDDPSAGEALALVGASTAFALLAWATFSRGLRRYTSGSVWTRA